MDKMIVNEVLPKKENERPQMRYRVSIKYMDFVFDNYKEAEQFMLMARKSYYKEDSDEKVGVYMSVKIVEEEKEENEEC